MADSTRTDGGAADAGTPARKSAPRKSAPRKSAPRKSAPRESAPRESAPRKSAPRKSAVTHVSGRAAARKVEEANQVTVQLPILGSLRLPEPQQLTYFAAIGALGVIGILDWPMALVLVAGHALASNHHNRVLHQFGEALEDA